MHSGPFGCLTKLGAKRAELVQKLVPRSRIRIFRNECTQSTPLNPKLMFWCVSYYLGAFGTVCMPYETRCRRAELVQKFVPRDRVGIFRNERTRSSPLDPKLMFWCVSYYLGPFGTVWLSYKTLCKTAELVQKFMPQSRVGIFCNERTLSTPLDPKLNFWCISYNLGAFGAVWVPYKTRCDTGRTSAEVRAPKSRRNLSHAPDPPL